MTSSGSDMGTKDGAEGAGGKGAEIIDALVIGAGPAGLMAAESLAEAGRQVLIVEAKPSAARKFLMAGKSGLNITKAEDPARFLRAYGEAADWFAPMLAEMGPEAVRIWATDLGQAVFTGSSGRVFPTAMKASPLLRAWLGRIGGRGVSLRLNWRWTGQSGGLWHFETKAGPRSLRPRVVVLALGGASWRRLGSDGAWTGPLGAAGVPLAPFRPANMGFDADWSAHMVPFFGQPLKPLRLTAGDVSVSGEAVISETGLEGGGIYAVSAAIRDGAALHLDLAPDLTEAALRDRLAGRPRKRTLSRHLAGPVGLSPVKRALLQECARPLPADPGALARLIKALPIPLGPPRPLDEAISTAGGVRRDGVDAGLMLTALPGVFVAGEMLDWEAPTGGYLITGCLATGLWAGRHAARWRAGT